jgi:hypothetical protein
MRITQPTPNQQVYIRLGASQNVKRCRYSHHTHENVVQEAARRPDARNLARLAKSGGRGGAVIWHFKEVEVSRDGGKSWTGTADFHEKADDVVCYDSFQAALEARG